MIFFCLNINPVQTFHCFFISQYCRELLTNPSRYKRAESNLQADEKGSQHWIQVVVWLYIFICRFIVWILQLKFSLAIKQIWFSFTLQLLLCQRKVLKIFGSVSFTLLKKQTRKNSPTPSQLNHYYFIFSKLKLKSTYRKINKSLDIYLFNNSRRLF